MTDGKTSITSRAAATILATVVVGAPFAAVSLGAAWRIFRWAAGI